MNKNMKIFVVFLCFIAIFSCNNDDNITTLDINILGENWNLIPNGLNFNVDYKVVCDDLPENYEWTHYSIEQFMEEWKPEKFR